jgi:hypothetical protein
MNDEWTNVIEQTINERTIHERTINEWMINECQVRLSRLSWLCQSVTCRVRSDDHNMSSHCSRVFLLLIERSVCRVQSDDCANSLDIGEHTSFLFRSCICLLLQNTSSRGSVDRGLVHHVAVRVFSCTLSEECYLNYNVMTNMSTCMSLALTRLCGECWLVLLRYYLSKLLKWREQIWDVEGWTLDRDPWDIPSGSVQQPV